MTIPNDDINGSTPPHILEKALSGELARDAGGDSPAVPQAAPVEAPVEAAPAASTTTTSAYGTSNS
jgi:hypothetical protein